MAAAATPPRLLALDLAGVVCAYDQPRRLDALARAIDLTPEEVHARVWEAGLDDQLDRGEIEAADAADRIRTALGTRLDDAALRALWASAFLPDPAMLALVDHVRDRTATALLTNNGPLILDALDHELTDVGRRFDLRGFSCRYRATKPDPEPYRALAAEAGLPPAEILFFDDTPEKVQGARAAGYRAEHFTDVATFGDALTRAGLLPTP